VAQDSQTVSPRDGDAQAVPSLGWKTVISAPAPVSTV
jgi:hypothetical protein